MRYVRLRRSNSICCEGRCQLCDNQLLERTRSSNSSVHQGMVRFSSESLVRGVVIHGVVCTTCRRVRWVPQEGCGTSPVTHFRLGENGSHVNLARQRARAVRESPPSCGKRPRFLYGAVAGTGVALHGRSACRDDFALHAALRRRHRPCPRIN